MIILIEASGNRQCKTIWYRKIQIRIFKPIYLLFGSQAFHRVRNGYPNGLKTNRKERNGKRQNSGFHNQQPTDPDAVRKVLQPGIGHVPG